MENKDKPAYPITLTQGQTFSKMSAFDGLTKRELMAAMAMQGLCANPQILINAKSSGKIIDEEGTAITDAIARVAIQQADALLTKLQTDKA